MVFYIFAALWVTVFIFSIVQRIRMKANGVVPVVSLDEDDDYLKTTRRHLADNDPVIRGSLIYNIHNDE